MDSSECSQSLAFFPGCRAASEMWKRPVSGPVDSSPGATRRLASPPATPRKRAPDVLAAVECGSERKELPAQGTSGADAERPARLGLVPVGRAHGRRRGLPTPAPLPGDARPRPPSPPPPTAAAAAAAPRALASVHTAPRGQGCGHGPRRALPLLPAVRARLTQGPCLALDSAGHRARLAGGSWPRNRRFTPAASPGRAAPLPGASGRLPRHSRISQSGFQAAVCDKARLLQNSGGCQLKSIME